MKLVKALKNLDAETIKELEASSPEELKQKVLVANQAMQEMSDALDANAEYQELLETKKAFEQGKKDVCKRQNSIITVCLSLLEGKGQ
jgi:hypothetical protein